MTPGRPGNDLFGIENWPDMAICAAPAPLPHSQQLGQLTEQLMLAAGCHVILPPAQTLEAPTTTGALEQLRNAMAQFRSKSDPSRPPLFWVGPSMAGFPVAAKARAFALYPAEPVQGFMVLVAEAISGSLIYLSRRPPVRVKQPIAGDLRLGGPYLVLVLCEAAGSRRIVRSAAYAVAIAHRQCFMPVGSVLERDIVQALIHLQIVLDAYGIECRITRSPPWGRGELARFCVTNRLRDERLQQIFFWVAPGGAARCSVGGTASADFVVNLESWRDGSFMAWLINACGGVAGGQ